MIVGPSDPLKFVAFELEPAHLRPFDQHRVTVQISQQVWAGRSLPV